jgi:hypothetical protein
MSALGPITAPGYEGEVEEAIPVHETHQAKCTLCTWEGEKHDEMAWTDAQAEAVEHWEGEHAPDEDEDEEEET